MSAYVRIPRHYRLTDLQFAYLDGVEDQRDGRTTYDRLCRTAAFCRPEVEAYMAGVADQRNGKHAETGGGE